MFETFYGNNPRPTFLNAQYKTREREESMSPFGPGGMEDYGSGHRHHLMFMPSTFDKFDAIDKTVITDQTLSTNEVLNYIQVNTDVDLTNPRSRMWLKDNVYLVSDIQPDLPQPRDITASIDNEANRAFRVKVKQCILYNFFGMSEEMRSFDNLYVDTVEHWFIPGHDILFALNFAGSRNRTRLQWSLFGVVPEEEHHEEILEYVKEFISLYFELRGIQYLGEPDLSFDSIADQRRSEESRALRVYEEAKQHYQQAINRYNETMHLGYNLEKTSVELKEAINKLQALPGIGSYENIVVKTHNPGVETHNFRLDLIALRQESIMYPYDDNENALSRLRRKQLRSEPYDTTEAGNIIMNQDGKPPIDEWGMPEFVMPKSKVAFFIEIGSNLNIVDWSMRITPLFTSDSVTGMWGNGQAHPHASSSGTPCLGDFSVPLSDALHKKDFIAIFQIMDIFCNTYNHHDAAGEYTYRWPNIVERPDLLDRRTTNV